MTDLSRVQQRAPVRAGPLGRRTNIIPVRRNQQPVRTETNARIRDAQLGDVGGTEEILRFTRKVLGPVKEFQEYQNQQFLQNERELSQQGSIDAATGNVDEELAEENASYNRAVQLGLVRRTLAGLLPTVQSNIQTEIAGQTGMTIEERRASIDASIEEVFAGTLMDSDGNIMVFGTAEANVYAANKMQAIMDQVTGSAYAQAQANMDQESIDAASLAATESVIDGDAITTELIEAHLTPTADRDAVKQAIFSNLTRYAQADPEKAVPALAQMVADIESGEAGDFFTTADELSFQALLAQAEDARERDREQERQQRHEAGAEEMFGLLGDGQLDTAYINEAAERGGVSQRFAQQMRNALEAEQRQLEADARARRSEARAIRAEQRATMQQRRDMAFAFDLINIRTGRSAVNLDSLMETVGGYNDRQMPLSPSQIGRAFSAMKEGREERRQDPIYKGFAAQISEAFDGSGVNASLQTADQRSKEARALSLFDAKVMDKIDPTDAFNQAMQEIARVPSGDSLSDLSNDDLEAEIERLQQ